MDFIDSHCHLPFLESGDELTRALRNAKEAGVVHMINVGSSLKDNNKVLSVARKYPQVSSTAGIYPHEDTDKDLQELKTSLNSFIDENIGDIVAVGECGIDVTERKGGRSVEAQVPLFEMQASLAKKRDLPLVVHNRNGDDLIIKILTEIKPKKGVVHCFSSDWDFAVKVLDLGFYISFSGFITYESRKNLLETVRKIPKDKYLVETDSPYLPPTGYRGQKNEPKYVRIVAEKIAEVKGISLSAVSVQSTKNAEALFGL